MIDHLKSVTLSHTNCTAIARMKKPKMRLMAPVAHGPHTLDQRTSETKKHRRLGPSL